MTNEQLNNNDIIIAIDGFSSCGKSTIAKQLAQTLNYIYVDTGAMYRAVTLYSIRHGLWIDEKMPDVRQLEVHMSKVSITFQRTDEGMLHTHLNGEDVEKEIRTMAVSSKVSPISTIPYVRSAMVAQQQKMGKQKGIVMDGRDIGTTVFPNADLKIFVTASPEVRAQRRFKELQSKGDLATTIEQVMENLLERDRIDSTREVSPLKQADDAVVLDNTLMTIDEQNAYVLELAHQIIDKK